LTVLHALSLLTKSDAYTYLGLKSGNPYGIKASLYASDKVLNKTQKTDGLFYQT
jgi:hypothetical protein